MSTLMSIQFEGKSYEIDDFELGDLEWLEDELGCALDEINPNSMKVAVRFVYLIKKRDDPSFTLDDARKLKLGVLMEHEDADAAAQAAAAKGPAAKRPTRGAKAATTA